MRKTFFILLLLATNSLNTWAQVPIERLVHSIAEKREAVPEFREVKKMADERGLRVWLFGGTAAGFAHYVKWDLERQSGNTRFQADRFDYDFMNIYRSTQDLDIVVDGTPEQVKEFQDALRNRFPYFTGSKSQWEVRSLRHKIRDKGSLLDNLDFRNQHTDSNSTGMIELTKNLEPVTRDLRDWTAERPQFLRDVAEDKLHYYFSEKHEETSRFRDGKNPPIFSVIRALTKAFQYELELRPEELSQMRAIIEAFDPATLEKGSYAAYWIEEHGKKLFRHAVDMQFAANTLDGLGLREKLIALSDPNVKDSLAWWLSKEPLRDSSDSRRLIRESSAGRTAAELNLTLVTHETSDFLAYESIRKSHKGIPNVFISRERIVGEAAAYGNGFYTRIGNEGARGSGFHIRFRVAPEAREGIDFVLTSNSDFVIWLTRDKIEVIQESLVFDPAAAISLLVDIANQNELGIREMFKRKLSQLSADPVKFAQEAERAVEEVLTRGNAREAMAVLEILPSGEILRLNPKWADWVEQVYLITLNEMNRAHELLNSRTYSPRILDFLTKPFVMDHPKYAEWISGLINGKAFGSFFGLGRRTETLWKLSRYVLKNPEFQKRSHLTEYLPEWAETIGTSGFYSKMFVTHYMMFIQDTARIEHWMNRVFSQEKFVIAELTRVFEESEAVRRHPRFSEWMDKLTHVVSKATTLSASSEYSSKLLTHPEILTHPRWDTWAKSSLRSSTNLFGFIRALKVGVLEHPKFIEVLESALKGNDANAALNTVEMLSYPGVIQRPNVFMEAARVLAETGMVNPFVLAHLAGKAQLDGYDPRKLEAIAASILDKSTLSSETEYRFMEFVTYIEDTLPDIPREKREVWIDKLVALGNFDKIIDTSVSKWVTESPRYADWLAAIHFARGTTEREKLLKRGASLDEIAFLLGNYKWEDAPAVPGRLARALRDRLDAAKHSLSDADVLKFEALIKAHHCESLLTN